MATSQLSVVLAGMRGEEGRWFAELIVKLADRVSRMPLPRQSSAAGAVPTAAIRYFLGASEWYIVEKDIGPEQRQCFGYAVLGGDLTNAEYGYISVQELASLHVEMDFHFTPAPIRTIVDELKSRRY